MPYPRRAATLTKPLSIRFTPEERAEIDREAAVAGVPCGEYVRRRTLGRPVRAHVSLATSGGASSYQTALMSQLNSLGGLLKNLHNQGLGHDAITAQLLITIGDVVSKLGDTK
ncbi:MAG: hypothetical protein Q8O24_00060 [Gallionellaceae bacterium]|nr:hypothetical protein [Gallionellaceae bacterium]